MKKFLLFFFVLWSVSLAAQNQIINNFSLSSYHPFADNKTDDTPSFKRLFDDIKKAGGGTVTIPAGEYFLSGLETFQVASNTTVFAYGAKFYLPKIEGDGARVNLFSGSDIQNFTWFGGHFKGYCFDHRNPPNTWEPNVNTRIFVINTSEKGKTDNLLFRDISSEKIAGGVVNISGFKKTEESPIIDNFATHVTVENCTFLDSGKFMWDYGLLWQIIVYSDEYASQDIEMAKKYFRNDLIRENVVLKGDKICFDNTKNPSPVSIAGTRIGTVCLFGKEMPKNIIRGKQYYVVVSKPDYIKISDSPGGIPISFEGTSEKKPNLIFNIQDAYYGLYYPTGAGEGKGCIDLRACKNTMVTACKISALGDAMHIYSCHNNIFSNNHILGARMGAFFLAEYCKNSTITGNTVDGTNGSRTMSIEKSNEDITVIGNTFRNGGRGSWINQPKNLIMQGNIFINNTTKGEENPWRGRKIFTTGTWDKYPELYFTTYQKGGNYGPVILRDNIFVTGPLASSAVEFYANGFDVLVEGNIFKGATGLVKVHGSTEKEIVIGKNIGMKVEFIK